MNNKPYIAITLLLLVAIVVIATYSQEPLKEHVRKEVFTECFKYYSSELQKDGKAATEPTINACYLKARDFDFYKDYLEL